MLAFDIITTEKDLEALAPEWRDLHARCHGSPVTDFDAFSIWWRLIGKFEPRKLHIITARRAGQLVGLLPCNVLLNEPVRVLQASQGLFPECELLCENPADANALWQAARKSPHYDFAKIRTVEQGTTCHGLLAGFAHKRDTMDSYFLRYVWASGEEWMSSLTSKMRNDYKRCIRRLEEKGPLSYETWESGPLPTAIIDSMISQKRDWCITHKQEGLFRNPRALAYFHEILAHVAKRGELLLSWLKCGDDVIAYDMRFVHEGVLRGYLLTSSPEWASYSPGQVMVMMSVMRTIGKGYTGLNFMHTPGNNNQKFFKQKFCNEKRECYEFSFSGSVRGWLLENAFMTMRKLHRKLDSSRVQKMSDTPKADITKND